MSSLLQDWTKQESEDAEGVVTFSYRTQPDNPPDVQTIQKQMAIVAWQPGPNRVVQVPSQVSRAHMRPSMTFVDKMHRSIIVAYICCTSLP